MKVTSCILVTDGKNLLGGLATGKKDENKNYDIAGKGCIDPGEDPLETAIRELKEETGIQLTSKAKKSIIDLGEHDYIKGKNIHIFSLRVSNMPDVSSLFCKSTFSMYGRELPEIKSFKIIPINEIFDWFYPSLAKVLNIVINDDWLSDEIYSDIGKRFI